MAPGRGRRSSATLRVTENPPPQGWPTDTASRPSWDAHRPAASGGTLGGRRGRPACSSPQKHRGRVRTSRMAPARCLVTARAAWLCRADRGPRSGQDAWPSWPSRLPPGAPPRAAPRLGFHNGPFLSPNCRGPRSGVPDGGPRSLPLLAALAEPRENRSPPPFGSLRSFVRWPMDAGFGAADPAAQGGRSAVCGRTGTHVETQGPPAETWRQTGREPRPRRLVARWILRRTRREKTLDTSLFPCFLIVLFLFSGVRYN